jgi:hypothetical protein
LPNNDFLRVSADTETCPLTMLRTGGAPLNLPPAGGAAVCLPANMGGIIPNYKQKSRKKLATEGVARRWSLVARDSWIEALREEFFY